MKKFFTLFLTLFLSLIMLIPAGCFHFTLGDLANIRGLESEEEPEVSAEYFYDDSYHWNESSDAKINVEAHGNDSGMCPTCGYYYECPNLYFRSVTIDGVHGYEVAGYDEFINPQYLNVKIPEYHQEADDEEPLPVISIGLYALSARDTEKNKYCNVAINSVKLHDNILRIKDYAFTKSNIKEIVIPDSVKGDLQYTFWDCSQLRKVVIGDGIERLLGYTFYQAVNLEEIILGESVKQIRNSCFYLNQSLKYIVLPVSLISIPERIYEVNGHIESATELFTQSGNPDIFLNISESELSAMIIEETPVEDLEIGAPTTTWGFTRGWSASSKVYYKGEWHYGEDGKPVADVEK